MPAFVGGETTIALALIGLALFILAYTSTARAGDTNRGKQLYESRCVACHSIDNHRVGPAHRGVFGRRAGAAPGYEYSAAVSASRVTWTEPNLDRWLANPEQFIPGQKMGYAVDDPDDRADLIAYLKSQSANPVQSDTTSPR